MANNPLSADEAMAKAKQLARQGNNTAAIALYQQILTRNPKNKKAGKALKSLQKEAQPSVRMGRLQADMGKLMQLYTSEMHDQAYTHAVHLARIYPEQPVPFNIMGVIQTNRGENREAIKCFEQALSIDATYFDALSNLGSALTKVHEYGGAIGCFQKAIQLRPKDADSYFQLGNTLLTAGKQKEAILSYEKAIDIRPLHSLSHYQLGRALESVESGSEALASYRNAIELDPKMVESYTRIGLVFQSRQQFDMAIAWSPPTCLFTGLEESSLVPAVFLTAQFWQKT